MVEMFLFSLGPCNHVVNVYLNLMVNHVVEQSDHGTLISCPSILQPERHDFAAKSTPLCNKSFLLHVLGSHLDLIVTGKTIHEGEDLMLRGVVNQNIDVR